MSAHNLRLLAVCALAAVLTGGCNRDTRLGVPEPTITPRSEEDAPGIVVTGSLEVDGRLRTYRLHVPAGHDLSAPTALVVALHGGGGNGVNLQAAIGLDAVADREGFLVVYPDGSGRFAEILLTWNAGNCCGSALDENVNDVGFLRAMIEQLARTYPIDPRRVYATGMSNGGMMSYRLACEAPDLFAAVAPVAGALNLEPCEPSEPISVLAIHGTADQHVLFEGGAPNIMVDVHERIDRSVNYAVTFWAARDGCGLEPLVEQRGTIIHTTYLECAPGLGVELLTVEGGAHAWPGGAKFTARGDEPSPDLNASEAIWAFFEAHPKP